MPVAADPGHPRHVERLERLDRLEVECARLRDQNAELCRENRRLQRALDAHVFRAQRTGLFGPVELSAGTAVGPSSEPP